jgi:carboxyl-terminal processing protease
MLNSRNIICCLLLVATMVRGASTNDLPKFDEVIQLLRAHLQNASQADLDRAATDGLIEELRGQVLLTRNGSNATAGPSSSEPLAKTALFNNSFAYFRVGTVAGNLEEKLRAGYQQMATTNKTKIKGVILDLRFAGGTDYAAAAATADCFLNTDQRLLDWGSGSARASKKDNAITAPVAILMNSKTSGAAEALAAALREAGIGLTLGGTTEGAANIFEEFPLSNGETLRIATAPIKLGDGTTLNHGLKPDIAVESTLADEKAYLADPYKILHPELVTTNSNGTFTNQTRRHINEAELVRERKAGENLDEEFENADVEPAKPGAPVLMDAVLVRALDLLKGLAVLQESHPG